METPSQNSVFDFSEKVISKLKQVDELLIKKYDFFMQGKNAFINSKTDLINYINKFYDDLKETFENDRTKNLELINNYFNKIKQEFDKIDELLQNNKRTINKGLNYINILKKQNFIEIKLVDQLDLIEQLNLNSLLDDNVNNQINLFLFQIKNNMLIPEISIDNKVYSLVQEIHETFNIKINQKFFETNNIEKININTLIQNNKDNIGINNSSSLFMNHNEIYLVEENSELKNLIEDLCNFVNNLEINLESKYIWFEPNSSNIYQIILDKKNVLKTEQIDYKYITNGASDNENININNNNNKKYFLFNDEFRISNTYGDLIYISGGVSYINNTKKILNTLHEYSLTQKTLKEKQHMKIGRIYHGIILINDILYICGGLDQNLTALNSCEKYIIKENKWENISSMKEPISKINLVQIDDKAFASFGGIKNDNVFNYNIHYYRIDTNTWFILENFVMPKGILFPGLCKINEKYILILGGIKENGEESNEVFRMDISRGNLEQIDKYLNVAGYSVYFPNYINNEVHLLLNHQNQKYPDRITLSL